MSNDTKSFKPSLSATDIGLNYEAEVLTVAVRRGSKDIARIVQHTDCDAYKAIAEITRLALVHNTENPIIYLTGDASEYLIETLRADTAKQLPLYVISWLAESPSGRYANLGSERMHKFQQALRSGAIRPHDDDIERVHSEVKAFRMVDSDGLPRFPRPDTVADLLGSVPAYVIATMLVHCPRRPLTDLQTTNLADYDPFKFTGHDPYSVGKVQFASTGHDPTQPGQATFVQP